MKSVQLDKNAGDRRWRDACREEGFVECYLLPRAIRDKDDDEILTFAIEKKRMTVTFDRTIHEQCAGVLAHGNPGVLIIRTDDNTVQRISTKTAPRILQKFKRAFPGWHEVAWKNSIVELTPTLVLVHEIRGNRPRMVACICRNRQGWQDELRAVLEQTAGADRA